MTKHTPGPWNGLSGLIASEKGDHIATVWLTQDDNLEANARLIAAAPELLEACEAADRFLAILKVTHPHLVGADIVDTLQAAIQKAKA